MLVFAFINSCSPPPPLDSDEAKTAYINLLRERTEAFQSAAYLIDLRINNQDNKFSTMMELYFSGDSVGFYGRGYLGKGTVKGNIINDIITVYFPDSREYFRNSLAELNLDADCANPSEVLFYVLSLLSSRNSDILMGSVFVRKNELQYQENRFFGTIYLKDRTYPKREKLVDVACGDSIVVRYMHHDDEFPYYDVRDILYCNSQKRFRSKGFIREQKYNIELPEAKFRINLPANAVRIDSF